MAGMSMTTQIGKYEGWSCSGGAAGFGLLSSKGSYAGGGTVITAAGLST